MDPCLGYLREIDILMESYEEVPLYEDIFEAADPEVGAKTAKNAEIEVQSTTLLEKAITAIRNIFNRISEIIHTIFTWLGMDKDEKTKYKQFVEECKRNPEFAKMKVTIHDYRKINEEWNRLLDKEEKKYKGYKEEEFENRPNLTKDIEEGIKSLAMKTANIAKAEGSAFAVEAALNYAKSCKENAAKVEMMLRYDMGLLDVIEKELGQAKMKKFKKQIKRLQSKSRLVRFFAGGRHEQAKTIRESLKETISNIQDAFNVRCVKNINKNSLRGAASVARIHAAAKNSAHADDVKNFEKSAGKDIVDINRKSAKRTHATSRYNVDAYYKAKAKFDKDPNVQKDLKDIEELQDAVDKYEKNKK